MADVNNNNLMESQILEFAKSATQQIVANVNTEQSKARIQERVAYFAKLAIEKVAKGESFDQIKTELVSQVQQEVNAFIQTEGVQFVGNMLGQQTGSPIVGALLAQGLASKVADVSQARTQQPQQQPKVATPPPGAWVPPDQTTGQSNQFAGMNQNQQQSNQQTTQQQPAVDPTMAILGTLVQNFLGNNVNSTATAQNKQPSGVDAQAMANILGAVLGAKK